MNDSTSPGNVFDKRYLWSSVFCLIAAGLCVGLNALDERPVFWAVVVIAVFLTYLVAALNHAEQPKSNPALRAKYGETIYFLGYLTTICALALLAWKIKGNKQLLTEVDTLLYKGGFAITSTVMGLLGMFIFRVFDQSHDGDDNRRYATGETSQGMQAVAIEFSKQSEEVLDRLRGKSEAVIAQLAQLGTEHTQALVEVFKRIEGFGTGVQGLTENLGKVAGSLADVQKNSSGAGEALASVAAHTTAIQNAVTKLDQVSTSLASTWPQIADHVEAAAGLTRTMADLSQTVKHVQAGFGTCQDEMNKFTETSKKSLGLLLETLDKVQQRTNEVGYLAEGVKRFVDAANTIAPSINAISGNLREIITINEAVTQLRANVQNLNSALAQSASATEAISTNSRTMTNDTRALVTEIANQVHDLKRLTQPLNEFATTMEGVQPRLDAIGSSIANLDRFATGIAAVQGSLSELNATAERASQQMQHLDKVVESFVRAVDILLAQRSSNSWPPGRRP